MSDSGALAPRRSGLSIPMPRFSVKYDDIDLNKVNPTLLQIVRAGAEWLPEGYRVQVTSGDRPNPKLKGSRHKGGGALDVEIVDPNGNVIPNEGAPGGGEMYRRLAHGVYNEAHRISPELAARVAWGGEFESVPPTATRPGSGLADYMHFDLGGRRGQWAQEGWAMPAAPGAGPPVQLAAAAPSMTSPLDVGDPSTWPKTHNIPPSLQGGVGGETPPPITPPTSYLTIDEPGYSSGLTPKIVQRPQSPLLENPSGSLVSGLAAPGGMKSLLGTLYPKAQTEYPQPPDDTYASGGVIPREVARAATDNLTPPTPVATAAGGPSEPGPRDTAGAGGPSSPQMPDEQMRAITMLGLMSGMLQGMKVTPINWDPFAKIAASGKADASFPRSALETSPLGKLVNVRSTEPISGTVPGAIQARPVQAAQAPAPYDVTQRMNLGLRERKDVRAGAETAG